MLYDFDYDNLERAVEGSVVLRGNAGINSTENS